MEESMQPPIIVNLSKGRQLWLSFLALIMALASLLCILDYQPMLADTPVAWLFVIVGLIGVLLCGGSLLFLLKKLFTKNPKPIFLVDERGVTDHSSAIAIGFIPWEDISFIHLQPYLNQSYISITLVDNEKYLAKMNWLQKYSCKANLKMGFPLVNVVLTGGKAKPEQIYQLILLHYRHKFGFDDK